MRTKHRKNKFLPIIVLLLAIIIAMIPVIIIYLDK